MNKTFEVTIEETICQTFDIYAKDAEEAADIVEKQYKQGDLVVENGECQHTQISVYDPATEVATEWIEI